MAAVAAHQKVPRSEGREQDIVLCNWGDLFTGVFLSNIEGVGGEKGNLTARNGFRDMEGWAAVCSCLAQDPRGKTEEEKRKKKAVLSRYKCSSSVAI